MSKMSVVRKHVEWIDGVSDTWIEWEYDNESLDLVKTLVVEVDCQTDPNSAGFRHGVLDAIKETAISVLESETTMIISKFRIVPKRGR